MFFKRPMLCVVALIAGVLVISGCAQEIEEDVVVDEEEKAEIETISMNLGHVLPETNEIHIACVNFKEYVEEKTNGQIEINVFPDGQLGQDRENIEAVQIGSQEMTSPGGAIISGVEPSVMVFDLPFLFPDKETAYRAIDGELGQLVNERLEEKNIKVLAWLENGMRHVTNSRNPIYTPEDLEGIKIRTMENKLHMASFRACGASPTPMSFGELYGALQQGIVDGQENPVHIIEGNKLYEVQEYLSLTHHVYATSPILINDDLYKSLPSDIQQILIDGAEMARDTQRSNLDAAEKDLLESMINEGLKVNDLSTEQRQMFIEKTRPVYDEFREEIGGELVDLALEIAGSN